MSTMAVLSSKPIPIEAARSDNTPRILRWATGFLGSLLKSLAMSFSVQLTNDLCRVEPGSTVPVGIDVVNQSDTTDRFEIEAG